jgi:hypothetical protein
MPQDQNKPRPKLTLVTYPSKPCECENGLIYGWDDCGTPIVEPCKKHFMEFQLDKQDLYADW